MKTDIFANIHDMNVRFGVHDWINKNSGDAELMKKYLKFRLDAIQEEVNETFEAYDNADPEEIVDGLIDIIVFAIGTLDIANVDFEKAWKEVYAANISKEVGHKPERKNEFGFPDLIKPEGWTSPNHENNHGDLTKFFS